MNSGGLVLASLLLTRPGHCPGKQNVCPAQPAQPSPASPAQPSPAQPSSRPRQAQSTLLAWPGCGATRLDCHHSSFVNPEVYSLL